MSNWPLVTATQIETLGVSSGAGTTVTSGALNTKGSYATLGTTSFAYRGFLLQWVPTNTPRYRADIAVNTGGSDVVIVSDLFIDDTVTANTSRSIFIPVRIPAGATVKMRTQASSATQVAVASLIGYSTDTPGIGGGFRALLSATDFTNTDPANNVTETGTTPSSFETVCASTSARFAGLYVTPANAGDTSRTASSFVVDLAYGSAGNEKVLFSLAGKQGTGGVVGWVDGPIPCDIPAGTRLSARVTCSAAGAADSFAIACSGLAA